MYPKIFSTSKAQGINVISLASKASKMTDRKKEREHLKRKKVREID